MLIKTLDRLCFFLVVAVVFSLSFSISLYEVTSVLLIMLSITMMVIERDTRVLQGQWIIFLIVYFVFNLLSITQSHFPADSWKGIFRVLRCILLCLAVIRALDSEKKFQKVFTAYLIAAFVVGMDGLIQHWTGFELIRHRSMTAYTLNLGRVTATFPQATDFSAYICLAIFFFAGILSEAAHLKLAPKTRWFYFAGAAALFVCLLWTYSRGAWVGIAAAFFLFAILKRKKKLLIMWVGVLIWVLFLAPPLLRDRVRSLWDPKNGSIVEREILMRESLNMLAKSPGLGFGINTFSDNAPSYKSKKTYTDVQYAHNGYLQMAVETGVLGLLSFLFLQAYFLLSTITVFFRKQAPSYFQAAGTAVVFGIVAFLIHAATDTDLHSLLLINNLWFCMGLTWAAASGLDARKFYNA